MLFFLSKVSGKSIEGIFRTNIFNSQFMNYSLIDFNFNMGVSPIITSPVDLNVYLFTMNAITKIYTSLAMFRTAKPFFATPKLGSIKPLWFTSLITYLK